MMDGNVGNVIRDGKHRATVGIVMFSSVMVYLAMLLYSGVHNWSLMTKGVPEDMIIWAALGVIALEISAIFLPLALHYWTHAPLHRIAALAFYAVDAGLIFLNVVLDYSVVSGSEIPGWMTMYLSYIVPATPIIAGMGWSILWLLDPSHRERSMVENLRASTREALAVRIATEASNANINELVEEAARQMAMDIVSETLGQGGRYLSGGSKTHYLPAGNADPASQLRVDRTAIRGANQNNGHRPDPVFFGDPDDDGDIDEVLEAAKEAEDEPGKPTIKPGNMYRTDPGRVTPPPFGR
jgi:hypothetical protein